MIQTMSVVKGEKRRGFHTLHHFQHLLWKLIEDPRSRRSETCKSQPSLQADVQNPMPNRTVRSALNIIHVMNYYAVLWFSIWR